MCGWDAAKDGTEDGAEEGSVSKAEDEKTVRRASLKLRVKTVGSGMPRVMLFAAWLVENQRRRLGRRSEHAAGLCCSRRG